MTTPGDHDSPARLSQMVAPLHGVIQNYFVKRDPDAAVPHNIRLLVREGPPQELGGRIVHGPLLLIMNLATAGGVIMDGDVIRLCPGQALLVMPHQLHGYVAMDTEQDATWLFCNFEYSNPARFAPLHNQVVPMSAVCRRFTQALVQCYADGASERQPCPLGNQTALLLALVLEELLRTALETPELLPPPAADSKRPGRAYQLLQEASRYIQRKGGVQLRTADIATAVGVSPGRLRNLFHEKLGMGPGKYMQYVRIQHACWLLDTTNMGLAEIARECGYASASAFSRAFHKNKGVVPREFRQQLALRSGPPASPLVR